MITTDFVHLHLPRTGGSALRHVLLSNFRDKIEILSESNHPTPSLVAKYDNAGPSFILHRNPWDWYVSWIHWSREKHDFSDTFEYHLDRMLNEGSSRHLFVPYSVYGSCSESFDAFTSGGVDFIERYEDAPEIYAILIHRYTNGRIPHDDLLEMLRSSRVRPTEHEHYSSYYTQELVDAVYKADKDYINRFGYEFEDES